MGRGFTPAGSDFGTRMQPARVNNLTKPMAVFRRGLARHRASHGPAYYRDLRLQTAQSILRRERPSVTEAGMRVGHSSSAAFSTAYRKQFGRAPSQEIQKKCDFDKVQHDREKANLPESWYFPQETRQ
ncbi:helix-turn-helix domain-containing protein [Roseovarius sp.]|uniref:helix-turn-helix domain-containing protein n=1 Tax=Roseovarius sp. TaxID=1486281 RepID=UPI003D14C8EE